MKNFFKRHSFLIVLIIAVIIAGTNYLVYPTFIKRDLQLVEVPVANRTLDETTQIDETMLSSVAIAIDYIPSQIITDKEAILNKYVQRGTSIPANGFFYDEQLTTVDVLFGENYANLADGKSMYALEYDAKNNVGSSFKKGMYINLYYIQDYESNYGTKEAVFGQLAEKVKVLDIDKEKNVMIIEVDGSDISYLEVCAKYGKVIPSIDSYSNAPEEFNDFYDIEELKYYISDKSRIYDTEYNEYIEPVEEPANQPEAQ